MDICEWSTTAHWAAQRHPWERARSRVVVKLIKRYLDHYPAQVLDIGSGDAWLASQLATHFKSADFSCVDTAYTSEVQASLLPFVADNVKLYPSFDALESQQSFTTPDLILLLDVIEHIANDADFLRDISERRLIGDDTRVLITVPAYQSLFSAHDRYLKHYRRYTQDSLRQVLRSAGYKTLTTGYFFSSLYMARTIQKMLKGAEQKQKGIGDYRANRLADTAAFQLLNIDSGLGLALKKVSGYSLPGLSCYAVCQKDA